VGYRGETYQVPLEAGGFNHNKNIDTIPPEDFVHPSRNILLNEGGIRKRGGTTPLDACAMFKIGDIAFTGTGTNDLSVGTTYQNTVAASYRVQIDTGGTPGTFKWSDDGGSTWKATLVAPTGSPQTLNNGFTITIPTGTAHALDDRWDIPVTIPSVTGVFDFTLANLNQFIVRATSDGQIWKTNAAAIKTGWAANKKVHAMQWADEVFFCNGANIPTVWNGVDASTTDLSLLPSDWTGSNYPARMIQHGRGNSLRNWALGCPSTPKTIYVTPNGTPKDFSDANVLTFNIETGDGFGIVGGIDFGDRLIVFGKNRSFIIDDADTNTANWGYNESQWSGGAATGRLIVRTPNDIVCMMEDGDIYSVTAAETYGDYKAASLTRPSYMHEWIKEYVNLGCIADFHALYDPVLRCILFFVARAAETEVNTALAYFIDKPPNKAWTILDNQDYESGYSALCSAKARAGAGKWKIYTGSYGGRIWKLNEENRNDNGNGYVSGIRGASNAFGNARQTKRYDRIKVISTSEGACAVTMRWWIDGGLAGTKDIALAIDGDPLGSFELGTGVLGGPNILENNVDIGAIGKRIQAEAYNSTANEDFFLSQFLFDFMPLGTQA